MIFVNLTQLGGVPGPGGQRICMAAPLTANSSQFACFLFGAHFASGAAHIISTTQFLMLGEFNETIYIWY